MIDQLRLEKVKSVLIIGMAGGLAKITAGLILKKYPQIQITGIDARKIETNEQQFHHNISYITMKYTRTGFERLFRSKRFDVVLHLGRIGHAKNIQTKVRLDLNVVGTGRIMDLCLKYGVKKVIILSTYHVYGALPDNSAFLPEDSPLRASIYYPELRDVVEMDQVATNNMWKYQNQMTSIVLRPCSIIGPQIRNAMTSYLLSPMAPGPSDYNPMFQFLHEFDMANILLQSIEKLQTGLYNVAPHGLISIQEAKKLVSPNAPQIPIFIAQQAARLIGGRAYFKLPRYLIDYVKYSCLISNEEITSHLGQDCFRYSSKESVELLQLSTS